MAARVVSLGAYVPFGSTLAPGDGEAHWIMRESVEGLHEEVYYRDRQVVWSAGQRLRRSFSAGSVVKQVAWTSFSSGTSTPAQLSVLHDEGLELHTERGMGLSVALPFVPSSVWPVPDGLLLQEAESDEIYSLFHPLAEPRRVEGPPGSMVLGKVCFSSPTIPYILLHDSQGQLTLTHLLRHVDLESQKNFSAACNPTESATSVHPAELTLFPVFATPCPHRPAQCFLIDGSAPSSTVLCVQVGTQVKGLCLPSPSAPSASILFTHSALSSSPIQWQARTALLLLSSPSSLALLVANTPVDLVSPVISQGKRISDNAGSCVTLSFDKSAPLLLELRGVFSGGLSSAVASALERALPLPIAGALIHAAALSQSGNDDSSEWKQLSSVINAALMPAPTAAELADAASLPPLVDDWQALLQSATHTSPLNVCATKYLTPVSPLPSLVIPPALSMLPAALLADVKLRASHIISALHTLYETLKLDARRSLSLTSLGTFLAPLASALGMPAFAELVRRDLAIPMTPVAALMINAPAPFSLHQWLLSCLTSSAPLPPLPSALPNDLRIFLRLYSLLAGRDDAPLRLASHSAPPLGLAPAACVVNAMTEERLSTDYLDMLPTGLSLPIREALYLVRPSPPAMWTAEAHALIGRQDLSTIPKGAPVIAPPPPAALAADADDSKDGILPFNPVSVLRFRADARLTELHSLLGAASPISVMAKSGAEGDLQEQQAALLLKVNRTLATCVGRGAATLTANADESTSGKSTPLTVALDCPPLLICGRLRGVGSPVNLDPATVASDFTQWSEFHNGAAAALRLSPDLEGMSAAWIAYQRPAGEPSATHGGVLLGLGLHGHLRALVLSQTHCAPLVFDYLRGHELTAIGLMLGLAASHRKSTHGAVVKILCVHLPPFHPPASAELEALKEMPNLQAAALIGLGLVYEGSANRRMTEVLLEEIGRRPPDERRFNRESHTMAAGCALGLICLGRELPQGLGDLKLFDRLCSYITGARNGPHEPAPRSSLLLEGKRSNVDITAPAAMCVLAFMYMQSNNAAAAAPLAMPASFPALEVGRPDLLILRVLCRNLILWDAVQPTPAWLESLVPRFLSGSMPPAPPIDSYAQRDMELYHLARLYIVTGGAMSIAFRYAGTQHPQAATLLLTQLQTLMQYKAKEGKDSKVLRTAYETATALVAASAAVVLSGSGDLRLLRLLRILHRRVGGHISYGHHLIRHMAVGFLFLGGGRLSFSTSKSALAVLLIALYPSLPVSPMDNHLHLQALRHLYVLAAEPRCVVCRDVDSHELCVVPLNVTLTTNFLPATSALSGSSPCLLPPWHAIMSLRLDTPRYFAREFTGTALEDLRHNRIILVRRRPGFLPYVMDPLGTLSLLSHPIPRARFSATGLARLHRQGAMLRSFAADPALHAFARHVCSDEDPDFAAFGNRILHECLAGDRLDALSSYLSLRQLLTHLHRERTSVALNALRVAIHFYTQPALLASLYRRDLQRTPLLDSAFIANARSRVQAFFTQKGFIGGPQSAAQLRQYLTSGEISDVSFGAFLSWHGLPMPQAVASFAADTPLVVCKTLLLKGGVSVPATMLLVEALTTATK